MASEYSLVHFAFPGFTVDLFGCTMRKTATEQILEFNALSVMERDLRIFKRAIFYMDLYFFVFALGVEQCPKPRIFNVFTLPSFVEDREGSAESEESEGLDNLEKLEESESEELGDETAGTAATGLAPTPPFEKVEYCGCGCGSPMEPADEEDEYPPRLRPRGRNTAGHPVSTPME